MRTRTALFIMCMALLLVAACAPVEKDGPAADNATSEDTDTGEAPATPQAPQEPEMPTDEPAEPEAPASPEPDAKFTVQGVEGDLIRLNPKAVDPDEDVVTYTFGEPFTRDGEWQTQIGDEGTYFVAVGATDGKGGRTSETVKVMVARANRAPSIECRPVTVNEGDYIDLHKSCTILDEDDEDVVVTYGGWMGSWRYQTTYEDAGTHTVIITASDRRKDELLHTVRQNVTVTVNDVNRAPEFSGDYPTLIKATEGDVITLPRDLIMDPDKDRLTVTFSEPFDGMGVWKTTLGDAGTYEIDVVASDGSMTEKRTVRIEVALRNTAPTLKTIPDITVDEGQTVTLPISATDREGDPLNVKVSGWMESPTRKTTYEDAGDYTAKVTVTDGTFTTDQVVRITVRDVNRPPVFVTPA